MLTSQLYPPNSSPRATTAASSRLLAAALCTLLALPAAALTAAEPLVTRWAAEVDQGGVLPEYPRPQLVRERWVNLNGMWDYAIALHDAQRPYRYDGKIRVPFAAESELSTVRRVVKPDASLWYRRTFDKPELRHGERLLLHFGAVDWDTTVWVNGQEVGRHQGGFDGFSFDITDALTTSPQQELRVRVLDPTSTSFQPRGKQVLEPGGIVYTAVTGIWQTVWLEPVPATYIESLRLTPSLRDSQLEVVAKVAGNDTQAHVTVKLAGVGVEPVVVTGPAHEPIKLTIPHPHAWSPSDPYLYDITVELRSDADSPSPLDTVQSYCGLRDIEVRADARGVARLFLNGKPEFHMGPLDQGWWPDGLYTAPTDDALRYDIEMTKAFGFNMCRKHVKVEPARWYYWCDKLGLLVWQDMPSGDQYIGPSEPDSTRSPESEAVYRKELVAMMNGLHNHPCVVVWVPFNEGWGQFKTNEIIEWVKQRDPSRVVDGPSGWADRGEGDMHDLHQYPGPGMNPVESGRASVLGEFGGLGHVVEGHLWQTDGNWGYDTFDTPEQLANEYRLLMDNVWLLCEQGLAAAVFTQTTDVEGEVNGLMTYDRAINKIDPAQSSVLVRRLFAPMPEVRVLMAASSVSSSPGEDWQYTTSAPADDWMQSDYDARGWSYGKAGFGTPHAPGAVVRTEWSGSDIWLRRTFEIGDENDLSDQGAYFLFIHHDEDADVYLNGVTVASLPGYTVNYVHIALDDQARKSLQVGKNVVSVHCRQTEGGQYIDLGLLFVHAPPSAKQLARTAPNRPGTLLTRFPHSSTTVEEHPLVPPE